MFSSVEELLADDEELIESVKPAKTDSRYFKGYFLAAVLFVVLSVLVYGLNVFIGLNPIIAALVVIAPLLIAVKTEVERRFVMYHFTDRKIVVERGIFSKNFYSVNYDKITHVETIESFQERLFNVSDIHLHTAGEDEQEIVLNGVKDASRYRVMIDERTG